MRVLISLIRKIERGRDTHTISCCSRNVARCNFEVPVRRCTERYRVFIPSRTWSIAQKEHNGACSQIGVHNEAAGRGGVRHETRQGGARRLSRYKWRGGEIREGCSPLIQNASAPLCCPGALPRPLILAKRQPFCT